MASSTKLDFDFLNYWVNSSFFVNRVNSIDKQLFDIIQIPTWFLTFSLGSSDLLGNGYLDF